MPGLSQKSAQYSHSSSTSPSSGAGSSCNGRDAIWSRSRDDVTFAHLHKFWSELPSGARQELLRIDKQTLFEQVRKNLYCSRCNGLLLEGFSQIVLYGKSIQQDATSAQVGVGLGQNRSCNENGSKFIASSVQDDGRDPSVHPWGGLATTRDGILTLLDCFLIGTPLEVVQNVFDSARARERERELLYPDACGGGGRGWISQGCSNSGRGHGMKETCALHTARLSCGALVDFWSALGEETRLSLLRMKEEDFIERLMFRFDSKRFCRDCRRNVLREFKELKELKRTRREPRCTSWFCVADTAFQYEVTDSTVQADWHECFAEAGELYQHFEWAVGTAEGKSDILGFEDVGLCGSVHAGGLDLGNITACFITLRAWKHDGRCTELSVKAHALEGRLCVHRRLIVGDGYVTITKGESIKRFFEHAEETEEEEDEDSTDKEGSELDSEGFRPQKHAKSPELARDFLLDAATVIFKEQVEKAFREGTARQNAHSIFVCLALGLLEERVHVACKEIITLEKQKKLLEEEAAEKREEEERKERKRLKEREKKLRRKEKLKGKEREREKSIGELKPTINNTLGCANVTSPNIQEEQVCDSDAGDAMPMNAHTILARTPSPDMIEARPSTDGALLEDGNGNDHGMPFTVGNMEEELNTRDGNGAFIVGQSKSAKRKSKLRKSPMLDTASIRILRRGPNMGIETNDHVRCSDRAVSHGYVEITTRSIQGMQNQSKNTVKSDSPIKADSRSNATKCNEKLHWPYGRPHHRYDYQPCGCSPQSPHKFMRESKIADKSDSTEVVKPFYWIGSHISGSVPDNCGTSKGKIPAGMVPGSRGDTYHPKKVWEPLEARQQANKNPSESKSLINSVASKEDAVFEKEDTSEGTTMPCMPVNRQDSNNYNYKSTGISSSKSGWGASGSSANHLNERNSSTSNLHHVESNTRQGGLFPKCRAHQMNAVSDEHAKESSSSVSVPSASNIVESSSCVAAITDISTHSSDHNGCMTGRSSSIVSKKIKGNARNSCTASENGCHYEGGDISHKGETVLHVPSIKLGNIQAFENEEATSQCLRVSSPVPDDLMDSLQTKGPSTSLVNGSGLPATKSTLPTVEVTPQSHILPMQIPSISSSMFPLHSQHNQGYYQSRGSWPAVSANGLLPFPQPNRFLFPGPAGYGLSPSRLPNFSLPYPSLQSLPPVVPVGQVPSFSHQPNSLKFKELSKPSISRERDTGVVKFCPVANSPQQGIEHSPEEQGSDCPSSLEVSSPQPDGSSGNSPTHDISGFSLFHFGGPAAVVTKEHDTNSSPLKEESMGESFLRSKESCIAPLPQNDAVMTKEQVPVEEYSLFAASHGNRFGFF